MGRGGVCAALTRTPNAHSTHKPHRSRTWVTCAKLCPVQGEDRRDLFDRGRLAALGVIRRAGQADLRSGAVPVDGDASMSLLIRLVVAWSAVSASAALRIPNLADLDGRITGTAG